MGEGESGQANGFTYLGPEEFEELVPDWISNRKDLNRAESEGILRTRIRYFSENFQANQILDDLFLRNLHRDMFASVWTWAGKYRTRELNLGIDSSQVATAVRSLLDFTLYRISDDQDLDLVTCELHHRLVAIHPFVNGNGRHGRLFVDLLRTSLVLKPFNWGGVENMTPEETRSTYLSALRRADQGDIGPLMEFLSG